MNVATGPPDPIEEDRRRSRRLRRVGLAVLGLVVVGGLVELGLSQFAEPEALVEVTNQGASAMSNVRFQIGGREARLPTIGPGETAGVYLAAPRPGRLVISYDQPGSALGGLPIEEFDPAGMAREHQKIVVVVNENSFQRYPEDAPTRADRLWRQFRDWLEKTQ